MTPKLGLEGGSTWPKAPAPAIDGPGEIEA